MIIPVFKRTPQTFGMTRKKKELNDIDIDFYTGKKLDRKHRSIEHLQPRSLKGEGVIGNMVITDPKLNGERGNMPLRQWFAIHPEFIQNAKNYLKRYANLIIGGKRYGNEVKKQLLKLETYM